MIHDYTNTFSTTWRVIPDVRTLFHSIVSKNSSEDVCFISVNGFKVPVRNCYTNNIYEITVIVTTSASIPIIDNQ